MESRNNRILQGGKGPPLGWIPKWWREENPKRSGTIMVRNDRILSNTTTVNLWWADRHGAIIILASSAMVLTKSLKFQVMVQRCLTKVVS